MKKIALGIVIALVMAFASGAVEARGQGGHYAGAHGSSHKGGHYINARTGNHYTHHK
jgi:hypothetical protein